MHPEVAHLLGMVKSMFIRPRYMNPVSTECFKFCGLIKSNK